MCNCVRDPPPNSIKPSKVNSVTLRNTRYIFLKLAAARASAADRCHDRAPGAGERGSRGENISLASAMWRRSRREGCTAVAVLDDASKAMPG